MPSKGVGIIRVPGEGGRNVFKRLDRFGMGIYSSRKIKIRLFGDIWTKIGN